jgi:hypothetical protein
MKWHRHTGGLNPYHNRPEQPMIQVGFRNRTLSKDSLAADKWRWKWGGSFPADFAYDIVAYREVAA